MEGCSPYTRRRVVSIWVRKGDLAVRASQRVVAKRYQFDDYVVYGRRNQRKNGYSTLRYRICPYHIKISFCGQTGTLKSLVNLRSEVLRHDVETLNRLDLSKAPWC
jgi:hypothetical protein